MKTKKDNRAITSLAIQGYPDDIETFVNYLAKFKDGGCPLNFYINGYELLGQEKPTRKDAKKVKRFIP